MASSNALVKAEDFALSPLSEDIMQTLKEELDGLGPMLFDNVKIPSGGGLAFEIPGDDPDSPDTVQSLLGVIVHHHSVNAYWASDYDGSNNLPDCSSRDGKQGVDTQTGEVFDCASCPRNQFGSGKDGIGKACKNGHRIYLLRENEALPILLTLPPTSLKTFKEYLAKRLIAKGKRSSDVLTTIKLTKEKNSSGIVYSACKFGKAADLTKEQIAAIRPTAAWIKSAAGDVPLAEELRPQEETGDGFVTVSDDAASEF